MGGWVGHTCCQESSCKGNWHFREGQCQPKISHQPSIQAQIPSNGTKGLCIPTRIEKYYHQVQLVGEGPLELVHGVCTWMMVIMNEFPELGALLAMQLQLLMCCRVYGGSGWRNMG